MQALLFIKNLKAHIKFRKKIANSGIAWLKQPGIAWLEQPGIAWLKQPGIAWLKQPGIAWLKQPGIAWLKQPGIAWLKQPRSTKSKISTRQDASSLPLHKRKMVCHRSGEGGEGEMEERKEGVYPG